MGRFLTNELLVSLDTVNMGGMYKGQRSGDSKKK